MKQSMYKKLVLIGLFALGTQAMAFIPDKPEGYQYHPEQSQEQVEQQQRYSGTVEQVGVVEGDVPKQQLEPEHRERDASALIRASQGDEQAVNALITANKDLENQNRRKMHPALWGLLGLLVVGVGLFAFKKYADKVVPPAPTRTKTRW